jgi:hypothetical protein
VNIASAAMVADLLPGGKQKGQIMIKKAMLLALAVISVAALARRPPPRRKKFTGPLTVDSSP